jgi:hypothetical protein
MAKDKSRQNKTKAFKEKQVKQNTQQAIPKTHMIPQTEWQSTTVLDLRGDLAEQFEIQMVNAFQALQAAGSIFQQMIAANIEVGKVKLNYIWNNGEVPTEEEVVKYKAAVEEMQRQRQAILKGEPAQQQSETGLVTAGGQPLTEENLESEKSGLIITP